MSRVATKSTHQIARVRIHVEGHREIKRLQGLPGKSASYTGKTG